MMLEPTPIGTPIPTKPVAAVARPEPQTLRLPDFWTRDPSFGRGFAMGMIAALVLSFLVFAFREVEWERKLRSIGGERVPQLPANRR